LIFSSLVVVGASAVVPARTGESQPLSTRYPASWPPAVRTIVTSLWNGVTIATETGRKCSAPRIAALPVLIGVKITFLHQVCGYLLLPVSRIGERFLQFPTTPAPRTRYR